MNAPAPALPDLSVEQIRALLAQAVENEAAIAQAQNTVLLNEEGGATFLQGIVDRTEDETTERAVKRTRTGIEFVADDGTKYRAYVVLTDVVATAALPKPARKKS